MAAARRYALTPGQARQLGGLLRRDRRRPRPGDAARMPVLERAGRPTRYARAPSGGIPARFEAMLGEAGACLPFAYDDGDFTSDDPFVGSNEFTIAVPSLAEVKFEWKLGKWIAVVWTCATTATTSATTSPPAPDPSPSPDPGPGPEPDPPAPNPIDGGGGDIPVIIITGPFWGWGGWGWTAPAAGSPTGLGLGTGPLVPTPEIGPP